MSIGNAMGRIAEIQSRFAGMQPPMYNTSLGFDTTLQTAQSQFVDQAENRLDLPSGYGGASGASFATLGAQAGPGTVPRSAGVALGDSMVPANQKAAFAKYARQYGVPVALAQAVGRAESNFNPSAQSPAGAVGIMQLMPATAKGLGVNPHNYEENIHGGIKYLAQMLDKYDNNATLALAAYNAGPGAVDRAGGLPDYPETQSYVSRVKDYARQFGLSL